MRRPTLLSVKAAYINSHYFSSKIARLHTPSVDLISLWLLQLVAKYVYFALLWPPCLADADIIFSSCRFFLWPPYGIGQAIIFLPWDFFLLFSYGRPA